MERKFSAAIGSENYLRLHNNYDAKDPGIGPSLFVMFCSRVGILIKLVMAHVDWGEELTR